MAQYLEKIGECAYDGLIASVNLPINVQSVTVKSGAGALKRGTVLAMSSGTAGTGKCVVLGNTAATNETLTAFGILTDDVDATDADTVATVYVTGCFNAGALTVKSGYTLAAADIQALRNGGILVENVVE